MEYVIVALVVLFAASLTFFSGFGLGTILLPVFSIYFDPIIAVGATAIVHFSNNIFKFMLVYKFIHVQTLLRFGIPALLFAALGGYLLTFVSGFEAIKEYQIADESFEITYSKIIIGALMIFFAWFDLNPRFDDLKIDQKYIYTGGALSGFFGGLSGHQGAFRATFLSKSGLTKEQFIGTSNAVSLVVDMVRISIYVYATIALSSNHSLLDSVVEAKVLLIVAIVFAFLGTFIGRQLIHKTTIQGIKRIVGALLFIMGALMAGGIL